MGVTRPISAAATRLKGKVLVSVLLFSMFFVFLYCPPTKADFAPVSSNTLNLSAEFGASWAKDDIPYSLVTVSSTNVTYLAGSTASFGTGGSDVWLIKVSSQLNVFPGIGSYYMDSVTWRKTYGGPQDELARSVIQSS